MKSIFLKISRTRYQTQRCGHRAGFECNNGLYALAGELIASLTGVSLEDMVKSFMSEIGMHSSTTIDPEYNYELLPNMASAYFRRNGLTQRFDPKLLRC
jgi:hypothetical protein